MSPTLDLWEQKGAATLQVLLSARGLSTYIQYVQPGNERSAHPSLLSDQVMGGCTKAKVRTLHLPGFQKYAARKSPRTCATKRFRDFVSS